MEITNRINIDFGRNEIPPHLSFMQGDSARQIEAKLYENNVPWDIPNGASVYIAFRRPDCENIKVVTLSDGSPIATYSGNVVTVSIPPEMTVATGNLQVVIVFIDGDGKQIATFPISVSVLSNPATDTEDAEPITRDLFDQLMGALAIERARITNLASLNEGSTTGDAELIDARVGADGNTYPSAGDAIRAQNRLLDSGVTAFTGAEICPIMEDHFVFLNSSTVGDIYPATDGFRCAEIPCTYGDVFCISGKGGSSAQLWAFVDENNKVIYRSGGSQTADNYYLSAPYGAVKFYANSSAEKELVIYKGEAVNSKFETHKKTATDIFSLLLTNNYDIINFPLDWVENDGYEGVKIEDGVVTLNINTASALVPTYAYVVAPASGSFYATGIIEENKNCSLQVYNSTTQTEYVFKDKTGIVFNANQGDTIRFGIYVRPQTNVANLSFKPQLCYLKPRIATTDEILPSSYPMEVGYKKSQQWVNLKWTPKGQIPMQGGASYFPANVTRTGMLYGEGAYQDKRVGTDVSLLTFMTAINNPYSLMYTENTNEANSQSAYGVTYYGDDNSGAYMGMSCNIFVYNALGSPITYSSFETDDGWMVDEGLLEKVYNQSAYGLELCDILATQGHARMITRLWKDDRNQVKRIQASEIIGTGARNIEYTVDTFNAMLKNQNYRIYRFRDLYKNIHYEKSPFVAVDGETLEGYVYNNDICTFAGDYASFAEGDLLHINYTKGDYTHMQIYKDDVLLETISIGDGHDVDLTDKGYTYGKYKARLTDGTNYSGFTYWEILNLSLTLDGTQAAYSTANGSPVFWSWCDYRGWHSHKHDLQGQSISQTIDVGTPPEGHPYLKVYVDGDYGRIARRVESN